MSSDSSSSGIDLNLDEVLPPHEKSDMALVGGLIRRIFRSNAKETARKEKKK